jgi:hypothetical protein
MNFPVDFGGRFPEGLVGCFSCRVFMFPTRGEPEEQTAARWNSRAPNLALSATALDHS